MLIGRRGIFPTVPVLTRLIRRHPRALLPLHRWLTRLLPVPGWCFLNLLTFRKTVVSGMSGSSAENDPGQVTTPSMAVLALAGVCLFAFALRVVGLQYGLPAVYNPDEVSIMARALSFARGTLNPHNFLYPTFYFYVLFAWVGVYLAWVWLSGRVASIGALQQLYFTDPTGIYTAGRALGVAAGTATILGLYRLAARLTDRRTAIAAAIFLAVSPLHVRDSHYVKHDVPATLAVVLAYLAMTRIWPSRAPGRSTAT